MICLCPSFYFTPNRNPFFGFPCAYGCAALCFLIFVLVVLSFSTFVCCMPLFRISLIFLSFFLSFPLFSLFLLFFHLFIILLFCTSSCRRACAHLYASHVRLTIVLNAITPITLT
uniref:Uncharacterized protein n=1 Tax=Palpitomonas bilix TaxID=652834 RepID=A0A7S3GJ96_9EUKA